MQDALGKKAIHAALRSLTSICSGLLDCEAESVRCVFGRVKGAPPERRPPYLDEHTSPSGRVRSDRCHARRYARVPGPAPPLR
jgi:hypothetical protein